MTPIDNPTIVDSYALISEFFKNSNVLNNLGNTLLENTGKAGSEILTSLGAAGVNIGLVILGEGLMKIRGKSSRIKSISKYLGVDVTQYDKNKILEKLVNDKQQFEKLNTAIIHMCQSRDFKEIHTYFNNEFDLSYSESFEVYLEIKDIVMDYQTLGSIIEICKKLVSMDNNVITKFIDLEDDLNSHFALLRDNISETMKEMFQEISRVEKSMKDQLLSLRLDSTNFELIHRDDLKSNGRDDCWLTGIFTYREINNQFDARRTITNDAIFSVDANFGTIVFGKGSFGKSKLAFRIIREVILKENYVVLFTDDVSLETLPFISNLIDDLIKKYPKILFVIDDAHKQGIEKIMNLYNNLFTIGKNESPLSVRFLFLAREREFKNLYDTMNNSRLQSEILFALNSLHKISIPEFELEDSIIFLQKALEVTFPNTKFDFVDGIAEAMLYKSNKNIQIFLCNLRQILKSLKMRESDLPGNLIYSFKDQDKSEFINCMQEQISKKIFTIKNSLKKEEVDSLLLILFLRMFGIKLSEYYFDTLKIYRHHLKRMSELDLISLDDSEYLHEDSATELMINIYKMFDNHLGSFDHEYQIRDKLDLIFESLQINDFFNFFSKCELLFDDKDKDRHTFPLGNLIMNTFRVPDFLQRKGNRHDLYKIYTHGLGNFYYHIGDYIKSIENHNKAIEIDPNFPDAYDGKGISLSRLGKEKEAIKEYNRAIEIDSTHENAQYNKAISLYKLQEDIKAIKEFDKALELKSFDPDAHYFKALCLHRLGKYDKAIIEFNKALKIDPFYKNAYIGRGSSYAELGKDKRAIKEFDKAIDMDPGEGIAHFNRAISLSNLGRFNESIVEYDKFLDTDPQNAMAHYNKGCSLLYLNKFKESILEFDKTIDIDPQNAMAHYNKGIALSSLDFKTEAIVEFDRAQDILPDYVKAYDSKGMALSELGNEDDAILEFNKAIEIDPTYANSHYNKALSLSILNRIDESIVEYDEAIRYEPDFVICYYNKAISQKNKGDFDDAIKTLETLLKIDPSNIMAVDQIAWIIANQFPQRLTEIMSNLKRLVSRNPRIDFLLHTYAFCLDKLGEYKEAIKFYKKSMHVNPDNPDVYYDLARSVIKSKPQDTTTFLKYLERAMKLDPEIKDRAKVEKDFELIKNSREFSKLVHND